LLVISPIFAGGVLVVIIIIVVDDIGTDVSDKHRTDDKRGTASLLLQLYKHLQHLQHLLFQRHTPATKNNSSKRISNSKTLHFS
jgi:hypothetical protein